MRSRRPTSGCCARWPIATAGARRRPSCFHAASDGDRGAPMRRCTCGPPASRNQPCPEKAMNAKPPETFGLDRLPTPIGTALLVTDASGVPRALDWEEYEPRMRQLLRLQYGAVALNDAPSPRDLKSALTAYFKG